MRRFVHERQIQDNWFSCAGSGDGPLVGEMIAIVAPCVNFYCGWRCGCGPGVYHIADCGRPRPECPDCGGTTRLVVGWAQVEERLAIVDGWRGAEAHGRDCVAADGDRTWLIRGARASEIEFPGIGVGSVAVRLSKIEANSPDGEPSAGQPAPIWEWRQIL
jgi:hypothetical protein